MGVIDIHINIVERECDVRSKIQVYTEEYLLLQVVSETQFPVLVELPTTQTHTR